MPIIPNFPPDLLAEHRNWHRAHHMQMMNPGPGYGVEFLEFHRDFIRRVLQWYAGSGQNMGLVAPWTSVPEPIRRSYCYNPAVEDRILRFPQSFRSADELGLLIVSSGLHGCIHEQAAMLFGEPELNDFDFAARVTTFYRLHGMIDQWYRNWESLRQAQGGIPQGRVGEFMYFDQTQRVWRMGKWINGHPYGELM